MLSSLLAPRLPAMCGRATLAMLVSSTSMNAAMATDYRDQPRIEFRLPDSRLVASAMSASYSM